MLGCLRMVWSAINTYANVRGMGRQCSGVRRRKPGPSRHRHMFVCCVFVWGHKKLYGDKKHSPSGKKTNIILFNTIGTMGGRKQGRMRSPDPFSGACRNDGRLGGVIKDIKGDKKSFKRYKMPCRRAQKS